MCIIHESLSKLVHPFLINENSIQSDKSTFWMVYYIYSTKKEMSHAFLHAFQQKNTLFIWAVAWDFQQFDILTSVDSDEPLKPPFKLRNSKWCSGSDQTTLMPRLIWGFAGPTYHIVENLMHWLIYLQICLLCDRYQATRCTSSYLISTNSWRVSPIRQNAWNQIKNAIWACANSFIFTWSPMGYYHQSDTLWTWSSFKDSFK